jgi:cytochrome c oxidase subunit 4
MSEPIISTRTLFSVCGALIGLTLLTIGASYVNLGAFQTPVALGIAAAKAILIALYFMQLRYSSGLTRLIMVVGLLWLALLLAGTLDDVFTRGWIAGR